MAVDGVDLTFNAGEFVAIEGPSGSGKTTLLQLLGALDRPSSGQVFFGGRDLATLGDNELAALRLRSFGFVFQQFNLIPTLSALENVEARLAPTGVGKEELRERSLAVLGEVGLAERAAHLPAQMSGGEQQRVAIARALVTEPSVVLADEPTGNLDSKSGSDIVEQLAGLAAQRGATVIVATHDADLAKRAPRRLGMRDGRLAARLDPCGRRRRPVDEDVVEGEAQADGERAVDHRRVAEAGDLHPRRIRQPLRQQRPDLVEQLRVGADAAAEHDEPDVGDRGDGDDVQGDPASLLRHRGARDRVAGLRRRRRWRVLRTAARASSRRRRPRAAPRRPRARPRTGSMSWSRPAAA